MNRFFQILFPFVFCFLSVHAYSQYSVKQADSILNILSDSIFNDRNEELRLTNDAISVFKTSGDTCQLIQGIINRSNIELLTANFEASRLSIIEAQKLFDQTGCELQIQVGIYISLANIYSAFNMYEEGYNQLWDSKVYKDSLLNIKKIEAVAEIEQKYEAEKKANELQTLNVDMLDAELKNFTYKRNQNRLIVGGLSLLVIAIFLVYSIVSIHRHRNRLSKKNIEIEKAKQVSDDLLKNILPSEIAQELKEKGSSEARKYDMVTILFSDFKEFTQTAEKLSATDLVKKINYCFKGFDEIMDKYNIEKIKTIGDAYMAAGGMPVKSKDFVRNTILAALEMQNFIKKRQEELSQTSEPAFEMRVGIHTGPVVAGIVGVKKFQYDVWGDTVNTASRMEHHSQVGKVNISGDTFELLKNDKGFIFEYRGKVQAKGNGEIDMYFVSLNEEIV